MVTESFLTGTRAEFLEKMAHLYDPQYFSGSDGLCPEELNKKIRALYTAGENQLIPLPLTRARMLECFLQNVQIAVNEFDPFGPVLQRRTLSTGPQNEILLIQAERKKFYANKALGNENTGMEFYRKGLCRCRLDLSHTSPDWDNLLKLGIPGLLKRAQKCWEANPTPFTESVKIVYTAFRDFCLRCARRTREENRPDLAEILVHLADNAPRTLRQALELGLLYRELQEIEGEWVRSMGIFDRMYQPFFEEDIRAGRLTEQEAENLLFAYFARFMIQSGGRDNGTPFCFGGLRPAKAGVLPQDGCNALTCLSWKVFRDLGRVDPKFSLRVNAHTPDDMLYFAAGCIQEGKNAIVFANEEVAAKMFRRHGKDPADFSNFLPVGCYEPVIMGKELSCTMTVLFNFAGLFETLFSDEKFIPATFEEVSDKYLELLKNALSNCMEKANRLETYWAEVNPSPLLSGTMDECMFRGLDVSQYGTKYASSGIMCAGLGTAVDSLSAIRSLVFEKKMISFKKLGEILTCNWREHEKLRLYASGKTVKWGIGNQTADLLGELITRTAGELIKNTPNVKGGTYQMGLWSIDWSFIFGYETGATPDGRFSGAPLSRNSGSSTSCDTEGIAGTIDSVSQLDHTYFADGAVLDVMLSPGTAAGTEGQELIVRLIKTFFARGGFFIQFNVLSPELLKAAQKEPEKYRNLQIRLCGWNVRFIDLAENVQNTFIAEAEMQG